MNATGSEKNEKNEHIPFSTIVPEKSCCLRKDIIRVAYVSFENPSHACPTIRILSPFRMMQKNVFLYSPVEHRNGEPVLKKSELYLADIILVQRSTFFMDHLISDIKGPWQKIIYEIDDLLIDVPRNNPNWKLNKDKSKIIRLIKDADAITVSTERLKRNLQGYNSNIHVIPNYIDPAIWNIEKRGGINDDERLTIAFIGTPTHQHDLRIIVPAIKKILARYRGRIVFKFFGCITDDLKGLEGVEFSHELINAYTAFASYIMQQKIDIALAPLVKNEFNKCKSNIKFLEYSICRIPGIYSRISPYSESIRDRDTGILCDYNIESWYSAMVRLIEDEALRNLISENAYQEVRNNYLLNEHQTVKWYGAISFLKESISLKINIPKTKKENYSIKVSNGNNGLKTLHSLYDPEAEAAAMVAQFQANKTELVVVLGLGLGYHIRELVRRYPDTKIIVIEASPDIYKAFLEYGVAPDIKDKVVFVIGYPQREAIKEVTIRQIKSGMLPVNVFSLPSALTAFPDYYRLIYLKLKNITSVRLDKKLRYPKFYKDQLTICLLDFGYFLRKELVKALKSLGHNVVGITGHKTDNVGKMIGKITKAIIETGPDFILTINHFGFDEGGMLTSFLSSIGIPVAIWYVDSPSIIVGAFKNNVSDNVVLFLWDDSYRHDMISIGFSNVYNLPLAADESIFKAIKLSKKAYRRYYSQAAFVGNSMVDAYRWQVRKIPEGFNEIVEEMARLLSKKRISFGEVLNLQDARTVARLNELSEKDLGALEAAVYWRATMIHRLKAVRRLGEFSPVIYGDDGWKELLDDSYDLRKKVNYYDVLPLVYNATDINFNATSLQMREAVNQRVFDVPACGAFLLTDHQSAIEELFDVGKEVITYKDKEEIPELVKYYLNHGDERKKIAASARDRVLREHTYKHRVRKIIEVMKKRFG